MMLYFNLKFIKWKPYTKFQLNTVCQSASKKSAENCVFPVFLGPKRE